MKRAIIIKTLNYLLILLWVYTAVSKIANPEEFKHQLTNQVFSENFTSILFYLIPSIELLTAVLLYWNLQRIGFLLSSVLMILFTGYILLILAGYYDRVPCSCGGVIKAMSWEVHFVFNLCFTAIAVTGYILTSKERRLQRLQ